MIGKALLAVSVAATIGMPALAAEPRVVGWVERVSINPGGLSLGAKLDTGAKTSSLHAADITVATRAGQRWVSFEVVNGSGHRVRFERPVVRRARIRRAGAGTATRPVIRLSVCLGSASGETEFTLTDRTDMNYQALIGR